VRAEIVAVGTEILLGQIANTNARWMSERLAAIGVDVLHHQVVGDNVDRIVEALQLAGSRSDVVVVTGGLGPTQDDLTRDAIAAALGVGMEHHPEIESWLHERFRGFSHDPMPGSNLRQAAVPVGARYIVPERGTAPGLIAELPGGARVYAVPGVPAEMIEMMEGTVLPELSELGGGEAIVSRVLRLTGIGESLVAEILDDLYRSSVNPTVAFLASTGEVKVRLTAKGASSEEAGRLLAPFVDEVRRRLGDAVFTADGESLEEVVLGLLRAKQLTLACAESLTGGSVGARLTTPPGASASFVGSAVSRETIDGPGVVSEACAREMAAGARKLFGSDVALALTGVAGPDPHGGKPPGRIWLGLDAGDLTHARGFQVSGERDRVVVWAQQAGLDLVRRYLEGLPLPVSETTV
jgi:competence/damage-inducible protein CinA-like protein